AEIPGLELYDEQIKSLRVNKESRQPLHPLAFFLSFYFTSLLHDFPDRRLRVFFHPRDVNDHYGFVPNNPGVMTGRYYSHLAGAEFLFGSVRHSYSYPARDVITHMW